MPKTSISKNMVGGVKSFLAPKGIMISQARHSVLDDIRHANIALLPLLFVGTVAAVIVGAEAAAVGSVLLWCVACLASGGTVGFLFGIPKSNNATKPPKDPAKIAPKPADHEVDFSRPNTNLEEVSDWLTKIIVGLGLVHLKDIQVKVMEISHNAASSLNPTPTTSDVSAATALVVGFGVLGFLCGYLYTRLFLQGAFSRSDNQMRKFQDVVATELSEAAPDAPRPEGEPSLPSPSDRQSAERVLQSAPSNGSTDAIRLPLKDLTSTYEKLRTEMTYGRERTRKMTEIASGIKRLALAAAPLLPELAQSSSPGERLAAVMILQMKFDPAYIEWLANRIVEEPAFCGYQAVSSLLARIPLVGGPEVQRIKKAVQEAVDKRISLGLEPESELSKLVDRLLAA